MIEESDRAVQFFQIAVVFYKYSLVKFMLEQIDFFKVYPHLFDY